MKKSARSLLRKVGLLTSVPLAAVALNPATVGAKTHHHTRPIHCSLTVWKPKFFYNNVGREFVQAGSTATCSRPVQLGASIAIFSTSGPGLAGNITLEHGSKVSTWAVAPCFAGSWMLTGTTVAMTDTATILYSNEVQRYYSTTCPLVPQPPSARTSTAQYALH